MGENTQVYEHADKVEQLTHRIQAEQPEALQLATARIAAFPDERQIPPASDTFSASRRRDAVEMARADYGRELILLFLDLVFGHCETARLPDAQAERLANDVITAAHYIHAGIDWAATSIAISRPTNVNFYIDRFDGSGGSHVPVSVQSVVPHTSWADRL